MTDISRMRLFEIKLLVIEYNKASQLDRSFSKIPLEKSKILQFRKQLIDSCLELLDCMDNKKLKNKQIRNHIKILKEIDNRISYGQAQKVINVCLKQYMFITNQFDSIAELDCPLDTITMKGYGITNNRMINVMEKDYLEYQKKYEEEYEYRILKDMKYDNNRIEGFLS